MTLSILQLNVNADNYWDKLVSFLTSHDFDILQLQEMAGKNTVSGVVHSQRDTFKEIQKLLEEKYMGEFTISQRYTSDPDSYMGNAIFYKKAFVLKGKYVLPLHKANGLFSSSANSYEDVGRTLLHLTLGIEGRTISFLTLHFAWGKTHIEKPHQTKQGEILIKYLQTVEKPFMLTGDFNLTPDQPLIKKMDALARNLTAENNVTNTLDPKNHHAKNLFPKGLAVDYIFVSKDIVVKNFAVVDEGLSDHLGLTVEIEI